MSLGCVVVVTFRMLGTQVKTLDRLGNDDGGTLCPSPFCECRRGDMIPFMPRLVLMTGQVRILQLTWGDLDNLLYYRGDIVVTALIPCRRMAGSSLHDLK